MYDSFLYGYGLTLAVSSRLSHTVELTPWQSKYLFFSSFFRAFITSEDHRKVYRDFLKYFEIDYEAARIHANTKEELASKLDEIEQYGFERWVSKNLFSKVDEVDSDKKAYLYMLYNYWGHLYSSEILINSKVQVQLDEISEWILQRIKTTEQIYTTNFDIVLDKYLNSQHLHGIFSLPLKDMSDIILAPYPDGKYFEYAFLFGTNGLEKLSRLDKIRQLTQDRYKLDFFYNHNVDLGHLLIYGLSFGLAEFFTEEFLEKFPEHENGYLVRSVDGHILIKLNERFQKKKLSKITTTYYTDDDLKHLEYIFSMTDFCSIVDFKHSSEVFAF